MERGQTIEVLNYYADIPRHIKALRAESAVLEQEYDTYTGSALNGMPHSGQVTSPVENAVERLEDKEIKAKLDEIAVRITVLQADRQNIAGQINRLYSVYKALILERFLYGHTWEATAAKLSYSRRQAMRVQEKALERLGQLLDDMPMAGEILTRARDARI